MKYLIHNNKIVLDEIFIQASKVIWEDIGNPAEKLKDHAQEVKNLKLLMGEKKNMFWKFKAKRDRTFTSIPIKGGISTWVQAKKVISSRTIWKR